MKTRTQPVMKGLNLNLSETSPPKPGQPRVLLSGQDTLLLESVLVPGQSLAVQPGGATRLNTVVYVARGHVYVRGHDHQTGSIFLLSGTETLQAATDATLIHFFTTPSTHIDTAEPLLFDSGSLQLLYSGGGTELSLMTLKHDMRFFVVPNKPEEQPVNEMYYILGGSLAFQHHEQNTLLKQGDCIVAQGLTEPVAFHGLSEVSLLYFSTQPNFEHVGQETKELMHLADTIEQKDGYTADHCKRIQDFSLRTAEAMGLSHDRLYLLNYGAYLHDIGKARLPEGLLQKPGKLTADEWVVMKQHPSLGKELLEPSFLRDVGMIVEQHHERMDGSGYPKGLRGLEISLEAYIVAVADTFDAITTDRPYRAALPVSHALSELRHYADIHYPSEVVEVFITANKLV